VQSGTARLCGVGAAVTTIGSLCTGYGGLDLAAERFTGGDTSWVCEYDKHPSTILTQRFPGVPNLHDLTAVDWDTVEPVDVLTAGYPCQPFSHAGQRRGTDDHRHLWPHIADAIRVLRPGLVLLENVAGHLSLGFGDVLGDLASLGYDTRWGVVRASDAGAPHRRARVFIAAIPANIGHERTWSTWGRRTGPADSSDTSAHPGSERHGGRENTGSVGCVDNGDAGETLQRERARQLAGDRGSPYGPYTAAIRRWEHILGRCAPTPTVPNGPGHHLNPRFVEWMMGLDEGWVTDTGIPRRAQLKALGNGVVPQQAVLAYRTLLA